MSLSFGRTLGNTWRVYRLLTICAGPKALRYASINHPKTEATTTHLPPNNAPPHQHQQIKHASGEGFKDDTEREVSHHANLAANWWDCNGPMRALHALNEIRVPFIRDGIVTRGHVDQKLIGTCNVLKGQKILEIGCGAGLLTEQLARLGACVTGIDLGEEVINAARDHLEKQSSDLQYRITYLMEPIQEHAKHYTEQYDAVVISEVLEHVHDKAEFLTAAVQTLAPAGSIFITGPTKSLAMWVGGVLIGEYVLNIAPKGTHHWDKLISPLEVQRILDSLNCQTVLVNGSTYDFWSNRWRWINSLNFCMALQAVKADTT